MKVSAAVIREQSGPFLLEELQLDKPRADEIVVRIAGVGICHTDLSCRDLMYPIPLPSVLGHEGSGIVEAVGPAVTKVQPGDHVVLSYMACGDCRNCVRDDPSHCLNIFDNNFAGVRDDGSCTLQSSNEAVHGNFFGQSSFANFALASESNTVKVRKDVPLELLGPLGCGFQTGAGAVMNTFAAEPGSSIAVFGCGAVGLSAIMAAKIIGCRHIIAIDINVERLARAEVLGATHILSPTTEGMDVVEAVIEITAGGADYSLESTALPSVFRQAVDSLSVTGVCGLVGAAPGGTEVSLDMNSIMFGRTVKGIIEGDSIPDEFIPKLIEFYANGLFPIDLLVTYYPFTDINQAVKDLENGTIIKAILVP